MTHEDIESSLASFREKLEEHYKFPCAYTIKAIGPNTPTFSQTIDDILESCLDKATKVTQSKQLSAGGKHQSIRITVDAQSSDIIIDLYEKLGKAAEIKYLL